MIDASKLVAGRETDAAVAECLGWTAIGISQHGWRGWPPNTDGPNTLVPHYSTTDAALTALEEWQRQTYIAIQITKYATGDWEIRSDEAPPTVVEAPTLYLAICRLIVESGKCDHLP